MPLFNKKRDLSLDEYLVKNKWLPVYSKEELFFRGYNQEEIENILKMDLLKQIEYFDISMEKLEEMYNNNEF